MVILPSEIYNLIDQYLHGELGGGAKIKEKARFYLWKKFCDTSKRFFFKK